MKVLIAGGTGIISSGIVEMCVTKKYEVYALTRGTRVERNVPGATYLYCNLYDINSVKKVLVNLEFDVFVDCQTYSMEQLAIMLEYLSKKCKQYVFVSSVAVYERKGTVRVSEADKRNFIDWEYSRNKIECENYLIDYCMKHDVNYTIIRPTVTYSGYRIPYPIITKNPSWSMFLRMIQGKPILACENNIFSIMHIEDFSRMVVSLFGNSNAYNDDFNIVSSNNDIYWDDVLYEAGKYLNVKPKIVHVPEYVFKIAYPDIYDELRFHKNTSQIFDSSKIQKVTGEVTKVSLENGVHRMVEEMRKEYIKLNLSPDDLWNKNCDNTLYYAYKNRLVSGMEYEYLEEYFADIKV